MKAPIEKHVVSVLHKRPQLFEIALWFSYVEDNTVLCGDKPTMCTDGRTVFYHPEVLKWPTMKIEGVLVHEWMHGGHLHPERLEKIPEANHELWNIACDAVINQICEDFGWPLPDGINIPWAVNMTAEQVYLKLVGQQKQSPKSGYLRKPKSGIAGKEKEVKSEAESMAALARLAASAKAAGVLPGGLGQMISDWLAPKVCWRAVLREYCTKISKDGWSYHRSNASYRARGVYVPGRYSKDLGDVIVVRDTSGSLHSEQREVASEAISILSECRPRRTIVIDCDAAVHRIIELNPGDSFPSDALGGGGTDFRPVFDAVEERQYDPQVMVFITDLCGTFPQNAPSYPVIWATIGGYGEPPFGQTVVVK